MSNNILKKLDKKRYKWLVTGVSGFIGQNILQYLISKNQIVYGIDINNIKKENLIKIFKNQEKKKKNFYFLKGNMLNINFLKKSFTNFDYILHQAAFSSVPLSIKKPKLVYENNVNSFLNLLEVSRINNIKKIVYASSSALYSDTRTTSENTLIKNLLSPYAESKYANECLASFYNSKMKMKVVGLRYFNVFGPFCKKVGKNLPVISSWINRILKNKNTEIFGSKDQTRDFVYVKKIAEYNVIIAISKNKKFIYNVGSGVETTLIDLFKLLKKKITKKKRVTSTIKFAKERSGDIKKSLANLKLLNKEYKIDCNIGLGLGLEKTIEYFLNSEKK
jgi:UDP-N-acetylglucosamine/UDP-N-acetylgalactosamine 4-epimerase